MRRVGSSLAVFALAAAVVRGAGQGPVETLQARDRTIRQVLGADDRDLTAADQARLRAVFAGVFDYEAHTRESLGRYWNEISDAERRDALRLIPLLLERSSMEKVRAYRSDTIEYLGQRVDPGAPLTATVSTRVARKGESWQVSYRMHRAADGWRIVDVIVEGASTVESNRAAFYKVIRAGGMQGLLEKLQRKAGEKTP